MNKFVFYVHVTCTIKFILNLENIKMIWSISELAMLLVGILDCCITLDGVAINAETKKRGGPAWIYSCCI